MSSMPICPNSGQPSAATSAATDLAADPRFASLDARNRNRKALLAILDERFATKTSRDWLEILEANGIPCAPINNLQAALNDPITHALNMVVEIEHSGAGLSFKTTGNPIRMSKAGAPSYGPPPLLGEHTAIILRKLLGYSEVRITDLLTQKAVLLRPPSDDPPIPPKSEIRGADSARTNK